MPPAAADPADAGAWVAPPPVHAANNRPATLARAMDRPIDLSFKGLLLKLRESCLTMGDRAGRWRPPSAGSIDSRLGLVSKGGDDDREDQEQPEGDALDLDRHAAEPKGVLHDPHREDGEHDARDRAGPAEDVHAAEQDDGHDGQGHALR